MICFYQMTPRFLLLPMHDASCCAYSCCNILNRNRQLVCYLLACSGDRFFADVASVWFIFFILSVSRLNRILHFR